MSSIRRFLVVVLLATITLINFLAALHGYRTSMKEAERLFDAQLADIAAVLAVTTGPDSMNGTLDTEPTSISFQVWENDVLTAWDDTRIEGLDHLKDLIGQSKVGEKVWIMVVREGKEQKVQVRIGSY